MRLALLVRVQVGFYVALVIMQCSHYLRIRVLLLCILKYLRITVLTMPRPRFVATRLRSATVGHWTITLPQALDLLGLTLVLRGSVVPEPTTMALGGLGLAALLVARRKKA